MNNPCQQNLSTFRAMCAAIARILARPARALPCPQPAAGASLVLLDEWAQAPIRARARSAGAIALLRHLADRARLNAWPPTR